jgi:Uma2 family endonuclease
MTNQERLYTAEEFEQFINLPENQERWFELIDGEIVEVPSNALSSKIAIIIAAALLMFVRPRKLGHVTGEQGGYVVGGERYAPDVAYISKERQPDLADDTYNPNAPDLAVEVISSNRSSELASLRVKISNYLAAGTVVWVVNPKTKRVEVHIHGRTVKTFREQDILDGGDVLPGFTLPVKDIFEA